MNQHPPGWWMLVLPALIQLALLASTGPALSMTAVIVKYRDFGYVTPFLLQFGLYVSPVGLSNVIPEKWRVFHSLNPIIHGFRWCILSGHSPIYLPVLAANLCVRVFSCGSVSTASARPKVALPTSSEFNR
jgi:lipopolysaccharide transport system permease protein